ncbi:MAG: hypothetical protein ACR2QO_02750, partial [Acidimicrobiales bacterium]
LTEGLQVGSVQSDVVDSATPEHRGLFVGLGIAFDLEDIQLGADWAARSKLSTNPLKPLFIGLILMFLIAV